MINENKLKKLLPPINQLSLFNYNQHFNFFKTLYQKGTMPNCILVSGVKGIGKSTFIYHFINYLLSQIEEKKYNINDYKINDENFSYRRIVSKIHPNFFQLGDDTDEIIKIDQSRDLIKFVSKSTYAQNIKLVLIDNIENLNLNASNALLKCIEEPNSNTFFFIIHNSSFKILNTIKSRCFEYKIYFSLNEKEQILQKLSSLYLDKFDHKTISKKFYFESPGNIIKYYLKNDFSFDGIIDLKVILNLIDQILYSKKKDLVNMNLLSILIENYYLNLSLNYSYNVNVYYFNFIYISKLIHNMKKYNLYEKNIFIKIKYLLANE